MVFSCEVLLRGECIVGSNALDERSIIAGIGPITAEPNAQNLAVGRKLMLAVTDRAVVYNEPAGAWLPSVLF